jgi:uncharacterized membrane protein
MDSEPASMQPRQRIPTVDIARGVALVAMAIYHFTWDMEFFGYADAGLTAVGGWRLFARGIASSFLFLVGVGLYLGHARGIRWPGFLRRLAMVAGAAIAISIATYIAIPGGFIFFGILHQIALASLLGLLFLRLPTIVTLLAAVAVIVAPFYLRSAIFDHPAWWWVGLSTINPRSNDYVPLFPWFGAVLLGIAAAKAGEAAGLFRWLAGIIPGRWARPLDYAGRHSLAFYLIHQPVLIGCVWLVSQVVPPQMETPEVQFRNSCERVCQQERNEEYCAYYCVCMLDRLQSEKALDSVFAGDQNNVLKTQVQSIAAACTAETDEKMSRGTTE